MGEEIKELAKILRESDNIVFFGGAGVSTESDIPDFRSSNGLWNEKLKINFTPEQLVSHTFFVKYPEEFFEFYKDKLIYPNAKPNDAHKALAKLEEMGKLKAVVTQNIDGLHQAAGSKVVYELHGSVLRNYCMDCGEFYDEKYILESEGIPKCRKCGGRVKPDVVAVGAPAFLVNGRGNIMQDMGTSFAAPIVCGLAACLWEALPEKTAKEIIELIRISSNNYEHPDNIYGYGIPKFWRAYMLGKANANAR